MNIDPSLNSTHGGNPLCCAATLASLEVIEEQNLVSESERKGKLMFTQLQKLQSKYKKIIQTIQGKGLVAAIHIIDPITNQLDSSKEKMGLFKKNPILGHITTFGGHPVIASAALANLKETLKSGIMKNKKIAQELVIRCLGNGLILFWLLFESKAVRITPSLTISKKEIKLGCKVIIDTLNEINNNVD